MALRLILTPGFLALVVLLNHAVAGDSRSRRQVANHGDNYNIFVRALPNPPSTSVVASGYDGRLPIPLAARHQTAVHPQDGQSYRPPLIPVLSQPPPPPLNVAPLQSGSQEGGGGRRSEQSESPPEGSQYRPPLLLPSPQTSNSQQAIYIGGQQYGGRPQGQLPPSPSEQQSVSQPLASVDTRHQKSIGSVQPLPQVIQKAPASEIEYDKGQGAVAKDRDAKDDEYIVYYYYYYDNDTTANNLTSVFDDIPNLESYDDPKKLGIHKLPPKDIDDKGVKGRTSSEPANAIQRSFPDASQNGLTSDIPLNTAQQEGQPPIRSESGATSSPQAATAVSVSVSVSEGSHLPPVSNIFRYGSNEVPRVPVTPLMTDEAPAEPAIPPSQDAGVQPQEPQSSASSSTPSSVVAKADRNENIVVKRPDDNNDVEPKTEAKEETTEAPTTTELPTTTEAPTTVTERSRRRPGGFNNNQRRRFGGPNAAPSSRSRPTARSTSTTTTTTTTVSTSSSSGTSTTRRSGFRGNTPTSGTSNRFRRPSSSNRARPSFGSSARLTPSENDTNKKENTKTDTSPSPSSSSTTTTKSRFGSNSFRSKPSVSRSPVGGRATPSSTTSLPRSRPSTSRAPSPSLLANRSRNRARPSFLRPRPGREEAAKAEEDKPEETTTVANDAEEATTPPPEVLQTTTEAATEEEAPETQSPDEPEPSKAPSTTTERNRFASIFRSRNRGGHSNRPRPNILRSQSR